MVSWHKVQSKMKKKNNFIVFLILVSLYGCNVIVNNKKTALIYTDKNSTQCHEDGMSLSETSALLINEGIHIVASKCGILTGLSVVSQCGASDLQINIHEIYNTNTTKSLSLGFKLMSDINREDRGYKIIPCKK